VHLVRLVPRGDAGEDLDEWSERPRAPVDIRSAREVEHRRVVDRSGERFREAARARARFADDRDAGGTCLRTHLVEPRPELRELRLTADERRIRGRLRFVPLGSIRVHGREVAHPAEPDRPRDASDRIHHGGALGERRDRLARHDRARFGQRPELCRTIDQVLPDRVLVRALGDLGGVDPQLRGGAPLGRVQCGPRGDRRRVLTRGEQRHERRRRARDALEDGPE
jgi:hypothetical protein